MRCLLRRKRRAVHTPEVALLSILSVTLWCACVGRELVQSHNMVYAAVTGGIFHATVSPSASSSLWGSVSGALAVSVSRPRAGARRRAGRGGATRARGAGAAAASCNSQLERIACSYSHYFVLRSAACACAWGAHTDAGTRHACTSLAYVRRCTPHIRHTLKN